MPLSISMTSRPDRACPGSVETTWPIRRGSVCDQRTPSRSITTTYSAWVASRTCSASRCTGPVAVGRVVRRSRATCGCCAVVCAIASARRIAWSSSWSPSGARNSPVSMVTPAAIASCISSTCENTRRGRPRRSRRTGGVELMAMTVRGAGGMP
ncbi:hypothetical protein SVIOM342S_10088 [Streptomyces violaceorubidus]